MDFIQKKNLKWESRNFLIYLNFILRKILSPKKNLLAKKQVQDLFSGF
jgi:hypothetical protein